MSTTTVAVAGILVTSVALIAAGVTAVVVIVMLSLCLYAYAKVQITPNRVLLTEARIQRRLYEQRKRNRRKNDVRYTYVRR